MSTAMKQPINEGDQKVLILTVCTILNFSAIIYIVNSLFNIFMSEKFIYDTVICYALLYLLLARSFFIVIKRPKDDVIFIYVLLLFMYMITTLIFPACKKFMFTTASDIMSNPFYWLFVYSLTGYMFTRYIQDYKMFYAYLIKYSTFIVPLLTGAYFIVLNATKVQSQYMSFAYLMLVPVVTLLIAGLDKKKNLCLLLGGGGLFIIFLTGARGPLISAIISIVLMILFGNYSKRRKGFFIGVGMIGVLFLSFYSNAFLRIAINISKTLGINSRTINLIIDDNFFLDSGRSVIQSNIMRYVSLIGRGMYGDRVVSGGSYAHNLIIEFISQYGTLLGPFFLIVIAVFFLRAIFSRHRESRNVSIILFSAGFIKLLFSSSYLNNEPAFFILLALGVNAATFQWNRKPPATDEKLRVRFDVDKDTA